MLAVLIGLGLAVLVISLVRRSRRKGAKRVAPGRHPLETWIDESLARELALRLELDPAEVLQTLQGRPEPDLVSSVEEAVRSVEVRFSRLPIDGQFEVRVDANLERGGAVSATRALSSSELPDAVRDDFARTSASMVFRAWEFPWSRTGSTF